MPRAKIVTKKGVNKLIRRIGLELKELTEDMLEVTDDGEVLNLKTKQENYMRQLRLLKLYVDIFEEPEPEAEDTTQEDIEDDLEDTITPAEVQF